MASKLKLGDEVKVMVGKDKGKTGKILKIDHENGKVWVSGCNMVKRAIKPRTQDEKGQIISREDKIDSSNVSLLVNGVPTRVGFKLENNLKIRYSKKNGEKI